MSEQEAADLAKKMIDSRFDFNDFLQQSKMMKSMGDIGRVASMLPGMANKLTPQQISEVEVRKQQAGRNQGQTLPWCFVRSVLFLSLFVLRISRAQAGYRHCR